MSRADSTSPTAPRLFLASLVVLVVLIASPGAAAERYDPSLRFRTLVTPHFLIHFHQREHDLARRLARVAEETHDALVARLGPPASRRRTHVILVDQDDVANGWASVLPVNTIQIIVAAPVAEDMIGNTDDWLHLVFTHEYAHILHLDRAGGLIAGLRRVFGRAPLLFPNQFLPVWQIEGIATHEESAVTGQGRVPSEDFRRIVAAAARHEALEPLDRVNGGLVDWPDGHAPYAYGAYFHDFLARRFGAASLRALADATARRLPYLPIGSFKRAFGQSLGELWNAFEADLRSSARAETPIADPFGEATRLTHEGFVTGAPRWGGEGRLFYASRTPHAFPSLMSVVPGGSPIRIATRVGGLRTAVRGSQIFFDQLEYVRHVAVQSDLYRVDLPTGDVRRLTRGARAAEPDVSPDGRRLACVVEDAGARGLAVLDLSRGDATPEVIVREPDTQFGAPRWSPDGKVIAAERRRLRGPFEIVIIDPASRAVSVAVSTPRGRNVTPEWSPDGRWLVFASDRAGGPLNLFAVEVQTGSVRRLPAMRDGATSPTVSPDGRTVAFVGYTTDGLDLFSMPFDPQRRPEFGVSYGVSATPSATPSTTSTSAVDAVDRPYRPWTSAWPRFWMPVVEGDNDAIEIGVTTAGADALWRHVYGVVATWGSRGAHPDWQAAYAYDRWRPTIFAAGSDDRSEFGEAQFRERTFDAGAILRFRRMRRIQSLSSSVHVSQEVRECGVASGCEGPGRTAIDRRALRGGWLFSSAKQYGYSISPEEGITLSVVMEATRAALGSTGDATAAIAQARLFPPLGGAHGTLAVRAAAAAGWGDDRVARTFGAGGAAAEAPGALGRDAIGLLRGYAPDDLIGRRAAVVNVDYRWPLFYVERGIGTWPIFVRSLHAAGFVDAGHAWNRRFRLGAATVTAGAEVSMDAVVGYQLPLTFAAGIAWRRPGDERMPEGVAAFARIGRAF